MKIYKTRTHPCTSAMCFPLSTQVERGGCQLADIGGESKNNN